MKIKVTTILVIMFIATSWNLTAQIPPNYIIIEFSEIEKKEDISGSYGVITASHHSETLKISYCKSIDSTSQLKDSSFSFKFNTSHHSIFFVSLKKGEEIMTIYFSTISNDAGYRYILDSIEFQNGTFHLNLLSSKAGIQRDYTDGSDKYNMTENGLNIDTFDLAKCRISKETISEINIIESYNKHDIEKGSKIKGISKRN